MNQAEVETTALSKRVRAQALLEEAAVLDGLTPYTILHRHQYGETAYVVWSATPPDASTAPLVLEAEFEPERGEELCVKQIAVCDLAGVSVKTRLDEIASDLGVSAALSAPPSHSIQAPPVTPTARHTAGSAAAPLQDRATGDDLPTLYVALKRACQELPDDHPIGLGIQRLFQPGDHEERRALAWEDLRFAVERSDEDSLAALRRVVNGIQTVRDVCAFDEGWLYTMDDELGDLNLDTVVGAGCLGLYLQVESLFATMVDVDFVPRDAIKCAAVKQMGVWYFG